MSWTSLYTRRFIPSSTFSFPALGTRKRSSGGKRQAEKQGDEGAYDRFSQFDSSRTGQLNSYDLQRLLAKDATMEAREDCVKMVSEQGEGEA
ncbi:MAG: hypothetical protein EOO38_06190 [Cytophagaceae bacterium]|nr:MAG: hypothetical protein EOO38_06190 [Cytophagaceae bacterium]